MNARVFSDWDINAQHFNLFREAIVDHFVCIMTRARRSVGSGVLVGRGGRAFVLTANHVIADAGPGEIEFFLRLPGQLAEVGSGAAPRPGVQVRWRVVQRLQDSARDISALEVEATEIPAPADLYDLTGARPVGMVAGISLVYCGVPTSAALPLGPGIHGITLCDEHVRHDPGLLARHRTMVRVTDHDPEAQVLVPYLRRQEGIEPRGFSGAGVWVNCEDAGSPIWRPRPALVGIIVGYIPAAQALNVTALPAILSLVNRSGAPTPAGSGASSA